MTCAIDHAIAGTIPAFLCRGCNPGEFKAWPVSSRPTSARAPEPTFSSGYRAHFPVNEKDLKARAEIEAQQNTRVVEIDGELTEIVVHKRPGIIAFIMEMMQAERGASRAEMVAALVKRFPDREVRGMTSTVGIQSRKLATRTEEIVGRGKVFYMVME